MNLLLLFSNKAFYLYNLCLVEDIKLYLYRWLKFIAFRKPPLQYAHGFFILKFYIKALESTRGMFF